MSLMALTGRPLLAWGGGTEIFLDFGYQPTPFAVVRRYEETYSPEEFRNNAPNR
jgi:hypothetical protein